MWSSYVKPIIWTSLVPCSTYYSTSKEVVDSTSTKYTTIPVTSSTWTTGTSYTTVFTTVTSTDHTTQTQTTDDTSWTTATATTLETHPVLTTQYYSTTEVILTTKPVSTTQYFQTVETIYTTQPVQTYETIETTVIDSETVLTTQSVTDYETIQTTVTGEVTQTDVQTIYTTDSVVQTYLTSQTDVTTLTSLATYQTIETISTTPLPPPSPSIISTPSSPPPVVSSSESVLPPPVQPTPVPVSPVPPVITPAPPAPPDPCTEPPYNEFFGISWFAYRPVPGAEPLATVYRTVDSVSNQTITSIFCNRSAFRRYYRTNLYECAKGCGPFQTLDDNCNIIVGPVFTGAACNSDGYSITQTGPSGNVVDLGTSIVGHGLTLDGRCIPETTTTLASRLIYTGDVRQVESFATGLVRRQDQQPLKSLELSNLDNDLDVPFDGPNAVASGVATQLPGAETLYVDPVTRSLNLPMTAEQVSTAPVETSPASPPPPSPPSTASVPEDTSPTESTPDAGSTPPADTLSPSVQPSEGGGSQTASALPPIQSTPQASVSGGGQQQGSTALLPSSEASLSQLTCVPLSMVIPSSAVANATEASASQSETTAGDSSVPQQTGNAAVKPGGAFSFLGLLCALVGLRMVV